MGQILVRLNDGSSQTLNIEGVDGDEALTDSEVTAIQNALTAQHITDYQEIQWVQQNGADSTFHIRDQNFIRNHTPGQATPASRLQGDVTFVLRGATRRDPSTNRTIHFDVSDNDGTMSSTERAQVLERMRTRIDGQIQSARFSGIQNPGGRPALSADEVRLFQMLNPQAPSGNATTRARVFNSNNQEVASFDYVTDGTAGGSALDRANLEAAMTRHGLQNGVPYSVYVSERLSTGGLENRNATITLGGANATGAATRTELPPNPNLHHQLTASVTLHERGATTGGGGHNDDDDDDGGGGGGGGHAGARDVTTALEAIQIDDDRAHATDEMTPHMAQQILDGMRSQQVVPPTPSNPNNPTQDDIKRRNAFNRSTFTLPGYAPPNGHAMTIGYLQQRAGNPSLGQQNNNGENGGVNTNYGDVRTEAEATRRRSRDLKSKLWMLILAFLGNGDLKALSDDLLAAVEKCNGQDIRGIMTAMITQTQEENDRTREAMGRINNPNTPEGQRQLNTLRGRLDRGTELLPVLRGIAQDADQRGSEASDAARMTRRSQMR